MMYLGDILCFDLEKESKPLRGYVQVCSFPNVSDEVDIRMVAMDNVRMERGTLTVPIKNLECLGTKVNLTENQFNCLWKLSEEYDQKEKS